ncbi:hypothetical protein GQX74_011476 [Glossina fuscipes]|nr:hypothetical protein GQX74_011476 [Glossina fuscipes]
MLLRCCDDDTVDDDEDAPPNRPPRRGLCKPTAEVPVLEEAIAATAAALVIFGGAITGGIALIELRGGLLEVPAIAEEAGIMAVHNKHMSKHDYKVLWHQQHRGTFVRGLEIFAAVNDVKELKRSFLRLPDALHPFYGCYVCHVLFFAVRGKDLRHINHYAHALTIAHCSCREPFHWRELAVVVDKIQCCLHHQEILNHLDDDPSFLQTWVTSYQYPSK